MENITKTIPQEFGPKKFKCKSCDNSYRRVTHITRVETYNLLLKKYMKVSEITNVVLVVNRLNVKIT